MILIKGFVKGVVDKGEGDKRWAIVGVESVSKNRNGFEETKLYELAVFGEGIKSGMHNAYRNREGVEMYVPIAVSFNEKYNSIRYELAGAPFGVAASDKKSAAA